ncbi:MAG: twin-arginine translocase TatA/TatE family subunit [Chloroflexi bacterium]|nr:MAG: twin-arginine translocase TatA/TatE family subunit [Chloroflexota bacterium]
MPFRMGPWEIALILLIILIVFGVGKLPQAFGAIGKGIRAFKRAESGEDENEEETSEAEQVVREKNDHGEKAKKSVTRGKGVSSRLIK